MALTKMFSMTRFLGLHESTDGDTQLKMGEASKMVNFALTDDGHITVRPAAKVKIRNQRETDEIIGAWSGYMGNQEILAVVVANQDYTTQGGSLNLYRQTSDGVSLVQSIALPSGYRPSRASLFTFSNALYILTDVDYWRVQREGDGFALFKVSGYVPLVITNAQPSGGGTMLQNINRLTNLRRIRYDGDGTAKSYVLPEEASGVVKVTIDNVEMSFPAAGSFNTNTHTLTFAAAPSKGINNVEIQYSADGYASGDSRRTVLSMRFAEAYNGPTDSRIFLYGDGSNVCIYSGVTEAGEPSAEYFPELFEVRVDANDSPITGMIRYNARLIAFKPDGTFSIAYDAVTLADGSTVPGFYCRTLNRNIGNQAMGQVQSVLNYPRTVANGAVYDWKFSNYYQDERNARIVSGNVSVTLRNADPDKIVAYDDNVNQTYYLFLNDETGTVLVHRYLQNAWTLYRGTCFRDIRFLGKLGNTLWFARPYYGVFQLASEKYDTVSDDYQVPIEAVWESGFMDFSARYARKNGASIWVSMFPQVSSCMTITAETDKRGGYIEKTVGANYGSYDAVDYAHWSYLFSIRPRIRRVKLKIKKFALYKLKFRVDSPGARATVLGIDLEIRYSGRVK